MSHSIRIYRYNVPRDARRVSIPRDVRHVSIGASSNMKQATVALLRLPLPIAKNLFGWCYAALKGA